MSFLREGAVKDLLLRGPSIDELIQWSSDLVLSRDNPVTKISDYARDHGLTIPELESLTNIYIGMVNSEQDKKSLYSLLSLIEDSTKYNSVMENKKLNMKKISLNNQLTPILEEIEWPEENREYNPEFGDPDQDDEDEPYPGGLTQDDYDEDEIFEDNISEESSKDYKETNQKIEKFMPDDEELQEEFYEIFAANLPREKKFKLLLIFFKEHADEEMLEYYLPEGGSLEEFIDYLLGKEEPSESDEEWVDPAGGTHYGDEEDPAAMYEELYMPLLTEAYGRGTYSIKKVEESILKPISEELGLNFYKGRQEKQENYAKKIVSQFYTMGNLQILVRTIKVVGMGADDAEIFILDKKEPSKGIRFFGMNGYNGLKEAIKQESNISDTNVSSSSTNNWTTEKINQLIKDLRVDAPREDADALFDIVEGLFSSEEGLEEFIKNKMNIKDPIGWFVDQL